MSFRSIVITWLMKSSIPSSPCDFIDPRCMGSFSGVWSWLQWTWTHQRSVPLIFSLTSPSPADCNGLLLASVLHYSLLHLWNFGESTQTTCFIYRVFGVCCRSCLCETPPSGAGSTLPIPQQDKGFRGYRYTNHVVFYLLSYLNKPSLLSPRSSHETMNTTIHFHCVCVTPDHSFS